MMAKKQMKIVRLLEPDLCLNCRFAERANVETASGEFQRMVYCRRLDCDNWDIVTFEPAGQVMVEGEKTEDIE